MKTITRFVLALMMAMMSFQSHGIITGELVMLRSDSPFTEAMDKLLDAIKSQGFTVTRIQRVDEGLTMSGHVTDNYRVVFFTKKEEFSSLKKRYPEMIPYLPLKIVIYAEEDETLLVTTDPEVFIDLYPDPRLRNTFRQWHKDIVNIMKQVQAL